jgi:hypothetical protein
MDNTTDFYFTQPRTKNTDLRPVLLIYVLQGHLQSIILICPVTKYMTHNFNKWKLQRLKHFFLLVCFLGNMSSAHIHIFIYLFKHRSVQIPRIRSPEGNKVSKVGSACCRSSLWNLFHVIIPEPRIPRWLLDVWKIYALLSDHIRQTSVDL